MTLLYLAASWLLLSLVVAAVLCVVARGARRVGELAERSPAGADLPPA